LDLHQIVKEGNSILYLGSILYMASGINPHVVDWKHFSITF
jgi:hypothetical protein